MGGRAGSLRGEGKHGDPVPIYPDREFQITPSQQFSPSPPPELNLQVVGGGASITLYKQALPFPPCCGPSDIKIWAALRKTEEEGTPRLEAQIKGSGTRSSARDLEVRMVGGEVLRTNAKDLRCGL